MLGGSRTSAVLTDNFCIITHRSCLGKQVFDSPDSRGYVKMMIRYFFHGFQLKETDCYVLARL